MKSSRDQPPSGLVLAGFFGACFLVAALGGKFTAESVGTWYPGLTKPVWTPPGWVFGPVWTVLYATMAVAAWLVWRRSGFGGARLALLVFAVQLVLNCVWSFLFFGRRSPLAGLLDIVLLWLAIGACIVLFWRHRRAASLLLLPYWFWVSFAAALNFAIWRLNPTS